MNSIFCKLGLLCILICYVLRCFENPIFGKINLSIIISLIPLLIGVAISISMANWFTSIGWLPR